MEKIIKSAKEDLKNWEIFTDYVKDETYNPPKWGFFMKLQKEGETLEKHHGGIHTYDTPASMEGKFRVEGSTIDSNAEYLYSDPLMFTILVLKYEDLCWKDSHTYVDMSKETKELTTKREILEALGYKSEREDLQFVKKNTQSLM